MQQTWIGDNDDADDAADDGDDDDDLMVVMIPGSSKKQPIAKKLACPLPPNSMLLHRFAWKGLQKNQPFRFGCRHALGNNIDQGGAGGSGVMWQHVGGLRYADVATNPWYGY